MDCRMIAQSVARRVDRQEGPVETTVAPARLHVDSPPLEPDLPPAGRKLPPLLMLSAVFIVAGLAYLTGAPLFVSLALLVIRTCGLVIQAGLDRAIERFGDDARQSRSGVEILADRMWEWQESEERLLGLIDALGDLVVHRDRNGHIVYANRV